VRYSDLTRRYFESTPAAGVLLSEGTAAVQGTFRGCAGQRQRGTWVQFDIQVQGGRILEARFQAFGCPHTIAVASWLAQQATRAPLRPALPESIQSLGARFEVPQEKLGRLLIIEDAWLAAAKAAIAICLEGPT
jgi:NifU-like protein involved in Fe-S cluster formation